MKALILAAMLSSAVVHAQVTTPAAAPVLHCGKYQHVDHWPGGCGPAPCDGTSCYAVCLPPPPDKCVDDIHFVTEREWQDILSTLHNDTESIKILHELVRKLAGLSKEKP